MDIPDFKTCKVIKIAFNKQIIDRCDSKIDFRATLYPAYAKFSETARFARIRARTARFLQFEKRLPTVYIYGNRIRNYSLKNSE